MARPEPSPAEQVTAWGRQIRQDVDLAIARARAAGRAGDLAQSQKEIEDVISHVKRMEIEAQRMRRQYAADFQAARVGIDKRGRKVTNLVGHGNFGNALRGSAQRGRDQQRAQLGRQDADVRSAFDVVRLDLTEMLRELAQEQRFISEMRHRTR